MESTIAILMADLTGYTAMTEIHGGESAAKMVQRYMCLVDGALHGTAKVLQRIGDQVVIVSENADDIFQTALQLNQLTRQEHQFLSVHAGLHYGKVFIDGNNLFGSTINITSRIMNIAQRGQVLCSHPFIDQLQYKPEHHSIGQQKLKNVIDSIELFELHLKDTSCHLLVDPVCHMQVDPEKDNYTFRHKKETFHFCSAHCRTLFEMNPSLYAQLCE